MKYVFIYLVRGYRYFLSPWIGNQCKFHPSCSVYALQAFEQHSLLRALSLICWRLLRCNPWSKGGVDPLPLPKSK